MPAMITARTYVYMYVPIIKVTIIGPMHNIIHNIITYTYSLLLSVYLCIDNILL